MDGLFNLQWDLQCKLNWMHSKHFRANKTRVIRATRLCGIRVIVELPPPPPLSNRGKIWKSLTYLEKYERNVIDRLL